MEAETEAAYSYWVNSEQQFRFRMHIRLRIPGDPDAHVSIALLCDDAWSDDLMDVLAPQLYRGVHRGLGLIPLPLPPGNVLIEIIEFNVLPSLSELAAHLGIQIPVDVIEVLVSHSVASLWYGLEL